MGIHDRLSENLPAAFKPVLWGLLLSYCLIILLSFLFSLVFYFTPLSELWMQPLAVVITAGALFAGGYKTARRAGSKGLFHGLIMGAVFLLITLVISLGDTFSWSGFGAKSLYGMLAAAIGGVSGVK